MTAPLDPPSPPGSKNPSRRRLALAAALVVCAFAAYVLYARHMESRLLRADIDVLPGQPSTMTFAVARGAPLYASRCASCHGAGGRGDPARGVPNLTDNDWLYGSGLPSDIERVTQYGIRARNPNTWNLAVMPAFATPVPSATDKGLPSLTPGQIGDVVEFIKYIGRHPADRDAAVRGSFIYARVGGCYDCHGTDAQGDQAIGAPNLTDNIWLYGDGGRRAIADSIAYGHHGYCPAWYNRLRPAKIRELSLYVYSLSHRDGAATKGR